MGEPSCPIVGQINFSTIERSKGANVIDWSTDWSKLPFWTGTLKFLLTVAI